MVGLTHARPTLQRSNISAMGWGDSLVGDVSLAEAVCQTSRKAQCFGSLSKTPTLIADNVPTYHHPSLPTPSWKM